jgi:hypothetical protein
VADAEAGGDTEREHRLGQHEPTNHPGQGLWG